MIKKIRAHALTRLQERYKINITRKQYLQLCDDIKNNRESDTLKFYRRKSRRLTLWILIISEKYVLAYYDKDIHMIVTFPGIRNVETVKYIFSRR